MQKKEKNKIVVLVPVYNPGQKEISNILSYYSMADALIIMDDSEKDNNGLFREICQNSRGKCLYFWNGKNLGLVRSVNKGFKHAISIEADWILVMDQDGRWETNIVCVYKNYLKSVDWEKKRIAVLLPQHNYDRHPRKKTKGYRKAIYGDMSGSLFNARVLQSLGFFEENTYFYGLEEEYYLRVRRKGYKIIRCMEAVIKHNPAHTETYMIFGLFPFKYGKDDPIRYYYQFRVHFYILFRRRGMRSLIMLLYKSLKIKLFFDRKDEYLKMRRLAWEDYRRGYYGKYEFRTV